MAMHKNWNGEVWYPWCFENISSQNTLRSELFVNLNDLGFGFRWICKVLVFLAFEYTSLFSRKGKTVD